MLEKDSTKLCAAPPLGTSEYIKIMPACSATDMGRKAVIGWECDNCPDAVRAAVAAAMAEMSDVSRYL